MLYTPVKWMGTCKQFFGFLLGFFSLFFWGFEYFLKLKMSTFPKVIGSLVLSP